MTLEPVTREDVERLAKSDRYWRGRWDAYLGRVAKIIRELAPCTVLEVGPHTMRIVPGSDTLDLSARMSPTYHHDATRAPWPIASGAYDLVLGLQVWEHLGPHGSGGQEQAFREALRVSRGHVLLSFPFKWARASPAHHGIGWRRIQRWTCGVHPERWIRCTTPHHRQRVIGLWRGESVGPVLGAGSRARVHELSADWILKLTADADDARASELVRSHRATGLDIPGVPEIRVVRELPDGLFAIVAERAMPLPAELSGCVDLMAQAVMAARPDATDKDLRKAHPTSWRRQGRRWEPRGTWLDRARYAPMSLAAERFYQEAAVTLRHLDALGIRVRDVHLADEARGISSNWGISRSGEALLLDLGGASCRQKVHIDKAASAEDVIREAL